MFLTVNATKFVVLLILLQQVEQLFRVSCSFVLLLLHLGTDVFSLGFVIIVMILLSNNASKN